MPKCPTCGQEVDWTKQVISISHHDRHHEPDMLRITRQIASRKDYGITFPELLAINLGDLTECELHQTVIPNLILSNRIHRATDKYGTTRYCIGPGEGVKPNGISQGI